LDRDVREAHPPATTRADAASDPLRKRLREIGAK
jgi:hypothetical protein